MESILDILETIKNEPKTNGKLEILESHKNNPVLKEVIRLCLDNSLQSGVKKIPDYVLSENAGELDLMSALEGMQSLYTGELSGNASRDFLASMLGSLTVSDAEVLKRVITKMLDCGIQAKNANKVYGSDFIAIEPYMRCSLTTEDTLKNIVSFKTLGYAVSEIKMDGQYLNHVVRGNNYVSSSRNGKIYDFLNTKTDDMIRLRAKVQELDSRFSSGVVLQGECLMLDDSGNIMDRKTGNGIIQKAGKDTISLEEAENVIFVLWDILPYDAFSSGLWDVERKERRELLERALLECSTDKIRMIEYRKVFDIRGAFLYNNEAVSNGQEGTILKCETGIWKSHTSPKQLKMKVMIEVDLEIVDFNVSEVGKRKDILGSISCKSSDGIITVNIGSGFKEKDSEWTTKSIWERRDELRGGILCAKTNGITWDKRTGEYSLYLATFVEFRFDKDTADSFERIKEIQESYVTVILNKLGE